MDEELKVEILEKNGNGQGDSNRIVNRNTQVHTERAKFCILLCIDNNFLQQLPKMIYIPPKTRF